MAKKQKVELSEETLRAIEEGDRIRQSLEGPDQEDDSDESDTSKKGASKKASQKKIAAPAAKESSTSSSTTQSESQKASAEAQEKLKDLKAPHLRKDENGNNE